MSRFQVSSEDLGTTSFGVPGVRSETLRSAAIKPLTPYAIVAQWQWEPEAAGDENEGERPEPRLADGSAPTPYTSVILPTLDGQERIFMAMRHRAVGHDPHDVTFHTDDKLVARGARIPSCGKTLEESLAAGLNYESQVRLLDWLCATCAPALQISREPAFIELCDGLVRRLKPQPAGLGEVVVLTDGLTLAVEPLPARLGPLEMVAVVGSAGVQASHVRRAKDGPNFLVIERHLVHPDNLLIAIGREGFDVRRIEQNTRNAASAIPWTGRLGSDAPRFASRVAPALAAAATRKNPKLPHLLWEMQLRFPWEHRRATGGPVRADVHLAIGHGAGGLFLSGWIEDPHDIVESLWTRSVFDTARQLDQPMYRIPRRYADRTGSERPRSSRERDTGFVTYLPGEPDRLPSLQHRVEVHLASGTRIGLVPPLPPVSFAERLAAVLSSVPPLRVTPEMLEHCIGPAAAELHRHHMNRERVDEVVTFGPLSHKKPQISVIIPLYRNLEFVKFQLGAFATDQEFAGTELIYVLDSPEQRHDVTHLFEGLHLLHGLPMKLIVMRDNFGFAAASNAGAQAARGKNLLMLNSDVIPESPGWLSGLLAALEERPGLGAVGPKLLYEDGSLQHAGLYFAKDQKGRWFNDHYYKGLPREFPPANTRRSVPAVTGACLMIAAKLFEKLGGFTEDYIYGDFEDSDLCLKIRREGLGIEYVPSVELYHLEWQSKPQHEGYMRSIADQYNAWLQVRRWGDDLAAVMAEFKQAGHQTNRTQSPPGGPGRKRTRASRMQSRRPQSAKPA